MPAPKPSTSVLPSRRTERDRYEEASMRDWWGAWCGRVDRARLGRGSSWNNPSDGPHDQVDRPLVAGYGLPLSARQRPSVGYYSAISVTVHHDRHCLLPRCYGLLAPGMEPDGREEHFCRRQRFKRRAL